jgi:parallel beta-helix repeat protein
MSAVPSDVRVMLKHSLRRWGIVGLIAVLSCSGCDKTPAGKTYHVNGSDPKALDTNPGSAEAPWKTISRAGKAPELRADDSVAIHSGVYRESVDITVSGEPGRPITFTAAPGARVVIKGSDLIRNKWTRLSEVKGLSEPFPGAFRRVWRVPLGEEFFTDARFPDVFHEKSTRWLSQVFVADHPLQLIGPDQVYKNDRIDSLRIIGRGLADMIPESFFFDPKEQMLYIDIAGDPAWNPVEVGVRAFALTVTKAHDVVVHGLEMRHNRQPGGQWPLAAISECQRVTLENCRITGADFNGLGVNNSKHCVVRRCDLSYNGCTGLALGQTEDCTVEDSTLMFNNYRHFLADWGVAGGMKNIPHNIRSTVRRCEAAYNVDSSGIWFDSENGDIRIVDNICHDNEDAGIVTEINKAGGVIAGNLVYGNKGRGIFVSGSQYTWVVHNTVANNGSGIVVMSRAKDEPSSFAQVLDNLLIDNFTAGLTMTNGVDLILEIPADAAKRSAMGSFSDYNVFASGAASPLLGFSWNEKIGLIQWQQLYAMDKRSVALPIPYERNGTSFRLLSTRGLNLAPLVPPAVSRVWKPDKSSRVGATLTAWPRL